MRDTDDGARNVATNALRVRLSPGEDVVVRTRFTDFTGKFVYHCHILNHEDLGMMAVAEVT
jgi:suppressor of ftsI